MEAEMVVSEEEEMEALEDLGEVEAEEDDTELDFVQFMDGVWYRRHDGDSILLLLEVGKKVYFSGKAQLYPVKGAVEVLGYSLTASAHTTSTDQVETPASLPYQTVFSPKGHSSLLYIEGTDCGEDLEDNAFPDGFAVIILRAFENPWTAGIRNTAANGDVLVGPEIHIKNNTIHPRLVSDSNMGNLDIRLKLPRMKNFLDKFGFQLVPEKLLEKNRLFAKDSAWDKLFHKIVKDRKHAGDFAITERLCVFGGKGVGKSTFCRWLTNKLLEKDGQILYIDLDPGQTEFTPPGIISVHLLSEPLLGPNFSHMRNPEKAIFLGGVNVADFPVSYINGLMELSRYVGENYANIPWIINTMGFSSGLGIPLAISVIKIFRPSIVAQLKISNNPKFSFPFDFNRNNISTYKAPHFLISASPRLAEIWNKNVLYNFFGIDSVFSNNMSNQANSDFKNIAGNTNPKSLREAMLVSYFSGVIGLAAEHKLAAVVPYRAKLQCFIIGCMGANHLNWDGVLRTLIGNLVALCQLSEEDLLRARKVPNCSQPYQMEAEEETQIGVHEPSKAFISSCSSLANIPYIGYALCRGYNKTTDELFLVTPLSTEQLEKVNTIICAGQVGLPVPLLGDKAISSSSRPHSYISGSKVNASGKKYFVPGKMSSHNPLKNSLFQ